MSRLATPVLSVEQVLDLPHDHQYDLFAPAQSTDPTINAIYEALAALGIAPADLAPPPFDDECSSMTRMDAELVYVDVDTETDPITRMVQSGCVNPALLMLPETARPLLPPSPSAVLPDQDMAMPVSQPFEYEFELREAAHANTVWDVEEEDEGEGDDVESDAEQEETEGEDDAQDSDFEERPKRRVMRPLPRRVAGKAKAKAATVHAQPRPTPTTSKVKPRGSRASPSVSESKSTSASSSSATAPKRGTKRKATRPAARRAPKKAAVARTPSSSTASLDLPHLRRHRRRPPAPAQQRRHLPHLLAAPPPRLRARRHGWHRMRRQRLQADHGQLGRHGAARPRGALPASSSCARVRGVPANLCAEGRH